MRIRRNKTMSVAIMRVIFITLSVGFNVGKLICKLFTVFFPCFKGWHSFKNSSVMVAVDNTVCPKIRGSQ